MNRTARTTSGSSRGHGRDGGRRSQAAHRAGPPRSGNRPAQGRPSGPPKEFALPVTHTPPLPAVETFAGLDMPDRLKATLRAQGMSAPFPIQAATLPNALAGRDVLGRGRTGSGKRRSPSVSLCWPEPMGSAPNPGIRWDWSSSPPGSWRSR